MTRRDSLKDILTSSLDLEMHQKKQDVSERLFFSAMSYRWDMRLATFVIATDRSDRMPGFYPGELNLAHNYFTRNRLGYMFVNERTHVSSKRFLNSLDVRSHLCVFITAHSINRYFLNLETNHKHMRFDSFACWSNESSLSLTIIANSHRYHTFCRDSCILS